MPGNYLSANPLYFGAYGIFAEGGDMRVHTGEPPLGICYIQNAELRTHSAGSGLFYACPAPKKQMAVILWGIDGDYIWENLDQIEGAPTHYHRRHFTAFPQGEPNNRAADVRFGAYFRTPRFYADTPPNTPHDISRVVAIYARLCQFYKTEPRVFYARGGYEGGVKYDHQREIYTAEDALEDYYRRRAETTIGGGFYREFWEDEWENVVYTKPKTPRGNFLYAAFGSNLASARMLHRCPSAKKIGQGFLNGWRLEFDTHADIVPDARYKTPAVFYRIKRRDHAALQQAESSYDQIKIGKYITFAKSTRRRVAAAPSADYLAICRAGYAENALPENYLRNAAQRAGVPKLPAAAPKDKQIPANYARTAYTPTIWRQAS